MIGRWDLGDPCRRRYRYRHYTGNVLRLAPQIPRPKSFPPPILKYYRSGHRLHQSGYFSQRPPILNWRF